MGKLVYRVRLYLRKPKRRWGENSSVSQVFLDKHEDPTLMPTSHKKLGEVACL